MRTAVVGAGPAGLTAAYRLCQAGAAAGGLLRGAAVADARVVRLRNSHPVYRVGFHDRMAAIRAWLAPLAGLQTLGRHGAFTFDNAAESMRQGMAAADGVLAAGPAQP